MPHEHHEANIEIVKRYKQSNKRHMIQLIDTDVIFNTTPKDEENISKNLYLTKICDTWTENKYYFISILIYSGFVTILTVPRNVKEVGNLSINAYVFAETPSNLLNRYRYIEKKSISIAYL